MYAASIFTCHYGSVGTEGYGASVAGIRIFLGCNPYAGPAVPQIDVSETAGGDLLAIKRISNGKRDFTRVIQVKKWESRLSAQILGFPCCLRATMCEPPGLKAIPCR